MVVAATNVIDEILNTEFRVGVDELSPKLQEIERIMGGLAQMKGLGMNIEKPMQRINAIAGKNVNVMRHLNNVLDQQTEKLKSTGRMFNMNSLSWLFGGMALQRYSMTVVRFFIPSMDKMTQLNDAASKKVMGVAAAFEYLKLSLFETLSNTDLFNKFIEFLIKAAIWIADFTQKHPFITQMAVSFAAIGVALGSIAMAIGIIIQLEFLLYLTTSSKLVSALAMDVATLQAALLTLGQAIALIGAVKFAFDALNADTFKDAFMNALIAGGLTGVAVYLAGGGLVLAFTAAAIVTLTLSFLWATGGEKKPQEIIQETLTNELGNPIFKNVDLGFNKLNETLLDTSMKVVDAQGATSEFLDASLLKLGNLNDNNTVIGRYNTLKNEIGENRAFFNNLTTDINTWNPPDKHVNIYYHHINRGGGGEDNVEDSSSYVSSITT